MHIIHTSLYGSLEAILCSITGVIVPTYSHINISMTTLSCTNIHRRCTHTRNGWNWTDNAAISIIYGQFPESSNMIVNLYGVHFHFYFIKLITYFYKLKYYTLFFIDHTNNLLVDFNIPNHTKLIHVLSLWAAMFILSYCSIIFPHYVSLTKSICLYSGQFI